MVEDTRAVYIMLAQSILYGNKKSDFWLLNLLKTDWH